MTRVNKWFTSMREEILQRSTRTNRCHCQKEANTQITQFCSRTSRCLNNDCQRRLKWSPTLSMTTTQPATRLSWCAIWTADRQSWETQRTSSSGWAITITIITDEDTRRTRNKVLQCWNLFEIKRKKNWNKFKFYNFTKFLF